MGRIKQLWPAKCPELRAEMHAWMDRKDQDGAASMLAYLVGDVQRLLDDGPDEVDRAMATSLARRHTTSLGVAKLFHITDHKMPEVLEAAGKLPLDMDVQRHWFHNDHGVMYFEKGYNSKAFDDSSYEWNASEPNETRIMALSWNISGDVIRVLAWTETDHFMRLAMSQTIQDQAEKMGVRGPRPLRKEVMSRIANIGPLMVCGQLTVKLDDYMKRVAKRIKNANFLEEENYSRHTMAVLLSACLMLKQYTTAHSVVEAPRSSWKRIQRMNPDLGTRVTVIDKRSIRPNPTKELDEAPSKRQLSVRYDRDGHWREYKSERFSPEVREHPIWIPAHWVGHEGLPLVRREKVTRLKR